MRAEQPSSGTPTSALESLEHGVGAALAYADVFDWPLTADEIHRTLPVGASVDEVREALVSPALCDVVTNNAGLHFLWGRAGIVADRHRREAASANLWKRATRYGRLIAGLPFVRMVAVSGSLAVNAAGSDADIDLLVVTEDERLWTTRALIIGVVRGAGLGARRRAPLCPNYLLSESNLELADRDCFTAHELAQLVPLSGTETYLALLDQNEWFRDYLPNSNASSFALRDSRAVGHRLEPLLRHRRLDRIERWEMNRKISRLSVGAPTPDARFDERTCKGHVDGHRQRILAAYESRLARLALQR